jgi:hypothetical protein
MECVNATSLRRKSGQWGTQPLPPKWTVRDSGQPTQEQSWVSFSTDLSKLLVGAPAFMRGEERFSAP